MSADSVLPVCVLLLGGIEALRLEQLADDRAWALSVTTAMALALVLRRVWPVQAAAVVCGLFVVYPLVDPDAGESLVQALALLIAVYAIAAHAAMRPALIGLTLGVVAGVIRSVLMDYDVGSIVANTIWAPVAWSVGRAVHERDRRASMAQLAAVETENMRGTSEREAKLAERRRIARELHDVVAHAVTEIVVQARGARRWIDTDPVETRAALDAIETMGAEAIDELRRMLALLDDPDEATDDAVRSGPAELEALVERVRAAGLPVELAVTGEPEHRVASIDVSAYRVVQEALTNALRHGERSTAHVAVHYLLDRIEVRVDSAIGRTGNAGMTGTGRGLVGLKERVRLTGGSLDVGVDTSGRYAVQAVLPYDGLPA